MNHKPGVLSQSKLGFQLYSAQVLEKVCKVNKQKDTKYL